MRRLSSPGLLGDDPNDDLALGKKYFRSNNFGLAEKKFRSAAEHHPNDAEAWVGLAASYDRLHRFDLADRAYAEAVRLIGPTVEILNDEGFSYMLRGDYPRAYKLLTKPRPRIPATPTSRPICNCSKRADTPGRLCSSLSPGLSVRHPEVLVAQRRASKGDDPSIGATHPSRLAYARTSG